jgi:hypothetical protein
MAFVTLSARTKDLPGLRTLSGTAYSLVEITSGGPSAILQLSPEKSRPQERLRCAGRRRVPCQMCDRWPNLLP